MAKCDDLQIKQVMESTLLTPETLHKALEAMIERAPLAIDRANSGIHEGNFEDTIKLIRGFCMALHNDGGQYETAVIFNAMNFLAAVVAMAALDPLQIVLLAQQMRVTGQHLDLTADLRTLTGSLKEVFEAMGIEGLPDDPFGSGKTPLRSPEDKLQ